MSDGPSPAELAGYVRVARDHREHERYHSVLKLEESAAWRRDANALKLLAARWSDSPAPDRLDPAHGAVGCVDLNDPAVVATTGILFMEGESEPAEITSLRSRFEQAAVRYQRLSGWLGEHMAAEWPRLRSLLVPDLVEAARPRFRALTRTHRGGQRVQPRRPAARLRRPRAQGAGPHSRGRPPRSRRCGEDGADRVVVPRFRGLRPRRSRCSARVVRSGLDELHRARRGLTLCGSAGVAVKPAA